MGWVEIETDTYRFSIDDHGRVSTALSMFCDGCGERKPVSMGMMISGVAEAPGLNGDGLLWICTECRNDHDRSHYSDR